MISAFFDKLSYRFHNENDLSDITWALAEACPTFKSLFINFFFGDITKNAVIKTFKREHADGDCRPDFLIQIGQEDYIIECKIYDAKHHFEKYTNRFPNAQFGYIANYPLKHHNVKIILKEWSSFEKYLKPKLILIKDEAAKTLITGYIKYLSNVCNIFNFEKMNLNNLTSLYHFNNLVRKVISSIEGYNNSVNDDKNSLTEYRSGHSFYVRKADNSITIKPWLGVYYAGRTYIYIEFSENGCKPVYNSVDVNNFSSNFSFSDKPEYDEEGKGVLFELSERSFAEFNHDATTVERQEEIIKGFLTEVLNSVSPCLEDKISIVEASSN